jgi:hypothetical protein
MKNARGKAQENFVYSVLSARAIILRYFPFVICHCPIKDLLLWKTEESQQSQQHDM